MKTAGGEGDASDGGDGGGTSIDGGVQVELLKRDEGIIVSLLHVYP